MFVQRMLKDPAFAAKVKEQQAYAAAKGHNADPNVVDEATAQRYLDEDEAAQKREKTEVKPMSQKEAESLERVDNRAEQVRVVAQSLAFVGLGMRAVAAGVLGATNDPEVARDVCRIIRQAHEPEELRVGEAFRSGEMIDVETVEAMLDDVSIRWVAVEAASGRGVERDGARLGVAAFSVAGNRCDVRFLCVRPTYHGLYVGHRLLERVERLAVAAGARQLCCCVPSCRTSMRRWVERRGFRPLSVAPFPLEALPFKITRADAKLVVYGKDIGDAQPPPPPSYDNMD